MYMFSKSTSVICAVGNVMPPEVHVHVCFLTVLANHITLKLVLLAGINFSVLQIHEIGGY